MNIQQNNYSEYGAGAILGALIGDAAGATLEFLGRLPNACDVKQALSMVGGGVWETAPGQITDDGEMTLALCQALAGAERYGPKEVARYYRRWRLSEPFDIGFATSSALADGELYDPQLADKVYANAEMHNQESHANGCLMRATPLGVWAARHDLETAIDAARQDARLTHPAPICQWATAAYVVTIRHLLCHPGDHLGAFEQAGNIVPQREGEHIHYELSLIREGAPLPDSTKSAGNVMIAFHHAFHHLYHASQYAVALGKVMMAGGDTDTNACITGGLLGALWGRSNLPDNMLKAVLHCDVSRGQPRPDWLQTRYAERWINALLEEPEAAPGN